MKGTVVVIPALNEARTILSVLSAVCEQHVDRVIAVDDGSSDETAALIAGFSKQAPPSPTLELIRHPANRGKGFALASGIARATEAGARRVITIDADGQHCASDIHRLERAAMLDPNAVVIAARTEAREQAPTLRRFANGVADFWISWACGRRVDDTQSGFRLYPATVLSSLSTRPQLNQGFAFETELLIDCVAAGAAVRSVAILTRYQQGSRRSHYRPWRDTWSIIRLVGGKLLRRGMYPTGLVRSLGWLPPRLTECRTLPMRNLDNQPIPPGATMAEVSKAIQAGGTSLGWAMQEVSPGLIVGTIHLRDHMAKVAIPFSTRNYSIRYKSSTNLKYNASKKNVHSNYNSWVINFDNQIRARLASL